jgi:2-dehydropantoate 2-reductase
MTFVLVGTGALGRTFGTLLAAAGHPVVLIGRQSAAAALGGLKTIHVHGVVESSAPLRTGQPEPGTVTVGRPGGELPRGAALLFTTKAHQLAGAANAAAQYWPAADDQTAWTAGFQNGLLAGDLLAEAFGPDRVVGACTVLGARRADDGAAVASMGRTYLGELDGGRSERVDAACAAFRAAGLPCDAAADIRGVLWAKMCHAVAVFGVSALTGLPTSRIMAIRPLVRAYSSLIAETASVARAAGVAIADYPDVPMRTERARPLCRTHMQDRTSVPAHASTVQPPVVGVLGPDHADALTSLLSRTDVSEQQILDSRPDRAHGQVAASVLLDLDHAGEIREKLNRAAKVIEIVHGPRRVLGDEFNVVPVPGLPH